MFNKKDRKKDMENNWRLITEERKNADIEKRYSSLFSSVSNKQTTPQIRSIN
jgi:hypothetical protein